MPSAQLNISKENNDFIKKCVTDFNQVHPHYERLCEIIYLMLKQIAKKISPEIMIQARAKSVPSYTEKILRKWPKYHSPLQQMTDLAGARVITTTKQEMERFCNEISNCFKVDLPSSMDVSKRHGVSEFGYRSVHYVVSLQEKNFAEYGLSLEPQCLPSDDHPMKIEIQVRTLLEHAWSVFEHDRTYKGDVAIPEDWRREIAAQAAVLETVDGSFRKISHEIDLYQENYSAYMDRQKIENEIIICKLLLENNPSQETSLRLGKLAASIADWPLVIESLQPIADKMNEQNNTRHDAQVLFELGRALYQDQTQREQGKNYLEKACAMDSSNGPFLLVYSQLTHSPTALTKAFSCDPSHPEILAVFLLEKMAHAQSTQIIEQFSPFLGQAIERCQKHIKLNIDKPQVYFTMGLLYLFDQHPYLALESMAKGILYSQSSHYLDLAIHGLEKLKQVAASLKGWQWLKLLLLTGRAARFPQSSHVTALREYGSSSQKQGNVFSPSEKILLLVGHYDVDEHDHKLGEILSAALHDYEGVIISRGTKHGISKFASELVGDHQGNRRLVNYTPEMVPSSVQMESHYTLPNRQRIVCNGHDFTPLEPLQAWVDILLCGIKPSDVRMIGIKGSTNARAQFQIAATLGCLVGLMEEESGAAASILTDEEWLTLGGFIPLPPNDGCTIRHFVGVYHPDSLGIDPVMIARIIHQNHVNMLLQKSPPPADPSLNPWDDLDPSLKNSNLSAAGDILAKLQSIGLGIKKITSGDKTKIMLTTEEVERLSEWEHGRWNVERLLAGWRRGQKNVAAKTSPYLVAWNQLEDSIKEYDRVQVRSIPDLLWEAGYLIHRP